jgi:GntR family carbon starvation induced transcriptional regulator
MDMSELASANVVDDWIRRRHGPAKAPDPFSEYRNFGMSHLDCEIERDSVARPPSDETLTDSVCDKISNDIIVGALTPGQKLRIKDLKTRYGIGGSPLREALARLTSSGFVTNETRRGFHVAPVSEDDLVDITNVRHTIELMALRQAIEFGDKEWESGIVSSLARLCWAASSYRSGKATTAEVEDVHRDFHRALLASCRSPRALMLHETLFNQASRYRRVTMKPLLKDTYFQRSHERLAKVVLSRNVAAATAELSRHLLTLPKRVYPGRGINIGDPRALFLKRM